MKSITNFILLLATIPSLLWLVAYLIALWPHASDAFGHLEPALFYDPDFKIARTYHPATDTMSSPEIVWFSFADGPAGIEHTTFAIPSWPIAIVASAVVLISFSRFMFSKRSPNK